jgi:hypothetical protein
MPVREPPLLGTSHFRVLIGRREVGFCEISRVTSATDVALPPDERAPGFETVVLRRALTQSTDLYDWRRKIATGKRARIVKHMSGPFNARASDVAMEEITLAYERLELD